MSSELIDTPDVFLAEVAAAIRAGEPVRREVPGGRLHIDRPLPFLCVARRRTGAVDAGPLVQGQGSYLVVDDEGCDNEVSRLVECVADVLAEQFGSALVLEIWVVPPSGGQQSTYRIVAPAGDRPAAV